MGVENNECVIATTWSEKDMDKIKAWVETLNDEQRQLFVFVPALVNHKETMFMAPDGSKKGWDIADATEILRDRVITKLMEFNYEDGSSPFDFIEVGYGEYGQTVLRGNCSNRFNDLDYAGQRN